MEVAVAAMDTAPVIRMPVAEQADDVTRVTEAIVAGILRGTVTEIRKSRLLAVTRRSSPKAA